MPNKAGSDTQRVRDISASFNEVFNKYCSESARVHAILKNHPIKPFNVDKTIELGVQCYSHITTSMDDARFWMKKLADGLEAMNEESK